MTETTSPEIITHSTERTEQDLLDIEAAAQLMRKFLNISLCNNKAWLLHSIQEILADPSKDLKMHSFIFENSTDAANWNAKILKENDFDYTRTVKKQPKFNDNTRIRITTSTCFRKNIWQKTRLTGTPKNHNRRMLLPNTRRAR